MLNCIFLARLFHPEYFWIGTYDIDIESTWLLSESRSLAEFTKWAPGQPDNKGADENCAVIQADGTWRDMMCHQYLNYICEKYNPYVQPLLL